MSLISLFIIVLVIVPIAVDGFAPSFFHSNSRRTASLSKLHVEISRAPPTKTTNPSPSFGQSLLNFALESPLWKHVMVPQARSKMQKTAEANGISWSQGYEWIESEMQECMSQPLELPSNIPSYYLKPFHAYEEGNLCWQSAMELELASASVGARNVPLEGKHGEDAFRKLFEEALQEAGAAVPQDATIFDLGCATGISTRRLARQWPQAASIVGIDLSPYFIAVGKKLLELQPKSTDEGGSWVSTVTNDERISYRVGDVQDTNLASNAVDIVQLQFVAHELPPTVAKTIVEEAHRIIKPGGQFWMCEMDFETPGYAAQRANPLLFSLIRATEPYLDEYADSAPELRRYIGELFSTTKVVAATGRHFALVATKGSGDDSEPGVLQDLRFDDAGVYRKEDTHLKVWEDKQESQ